MEKKSKLNPKQKRILNITIITLQVIFVLVCIIFSIFIAASSTGNKKGELNGAVNLMPVMSNSMQGNEKDSFNTNDLIIVKKLDDEGRKNLKVGDIVTFKTYEPAVKAVIYVSHRIIEITPNGAIVTQGDYAKVISPNSKEVHTAKDIEGIYTGKIAKLGGVITFLKKPGPFFGLIVTPLALLLLYNIYLVVKAVLDNKLVKLKEQQQKELEMALQAVGINVNNNVNADMTNTATQSAESATAPTATEESEEDKKKRIIAEYLAEEERKKQEEEKKKIIEEYLAEQNKEKKE